MTILQGIDVIEISATGAAALAAKHFADWGARVTVLEPAAGTPLRDETPHYEIDGERRSATWAWLSRGKRSVRVGVEEARSLCERASVVLVESELTREVVGLEPGQVRSALEGKTSCVLIAPFATDGPYGEYVASDLGVCALGGWMSVLGNPSREPLRPGNGMAARATGVYAFVAALVALRHQRLGGTPQYAEVSMQAVAASMISAPWMVKAILGLDYERNGNPWPMGTMPCADGYIGIPPLTAQHWELLCRLMGIEDVLDDPQGRDPIYRARYSRELYQRVKPWLQERSKQQIFEEAQAWRLPAAQVQTIEERLACPQLATRDFWREVEIDGRTLKTPRVPYLIDGLEPAPLAPLREVDRVDISPAPPAAGGSNPPLPFEGLRVLDLTSFWSGPYATMLLGTLGADVIKVESVQRPDPYRYQLASPNRERWYEWGPLFSDANSDKRDVTLDLRSEVGRKLFERLVERSDVVISNFANRVMPNLGLNNERLLEVNPRLIAVTMPGYGPGGPWESYIGYAIAFEQLVCGSMTGYADGVPSYAGGFCDPLVGMHTVAAIELALLQRERTGRGVEVEVPQCEVLESVMAPEQIAVQLGAPAPGRRGDKHDWMAPHDAYRVAGEDEWITIAIATDAEFVALCETLEAPELVADARFSSVASRKKHETQLDAAIAEVTSQHDGVELERALQARGVRACRVLKAFRLPEDEGIRHIGFIQPLERELSGVLPHKTWPFRFSDIDTAHKRPPPLLGEHNVEVLCGLLGLSQGEIDRLAAEQVTGTEPLGL